MDKRLPTIERMPEIETPVIDIQDLEHHPDSGTRVHDAGIEVLPQLDLAAGGQRDACGHRRAGGGHQGLAAGLRMGKIYTSRDTDKFLGVTPTCDRRKTR